MKTKRLTLYFLTSCFLFLNIPGTISQFMPDSNASWQIYGNTHSYTFNFTEDTYNYIYTVESDTIINGLTYNKIILNGTYKDIEFNYSSSYPDPYVANEYTYNNKYIGGIREQDSSVFILSAQDVEHLFMSFNTTVGDTILNVMTYANAFLTQVETDTFFVDSVTDQMVNNINFRTVFGNTPSWDQNEQVTQNLGRKSGFLWQNYADVSNFPTINLYNFCWEGDAYNSDLEYTSGCQYLSTNKVKSNNGITIFPNPSSDLLNIYLSNSEHYLMSIFNIQGKEMQSSLQISNMKTVNIGHLEAGIYVLRFTNEKGEVTTLKFTKKQ